MPEGPLGGPRPLASADIVIRYKGDISNSPLLDLTAPERRSVLEEDIREESNNTVDVKFTSGNTVILTRRDIVRYDDMVSIVEAIKEVNNRYEIRIIDDSIEIITDGQ